MNLLLLFPEDFIASNRVRLTDYRAEHIRKILKASVGQPLKIGVVQKGTGEGEVVLIEKDKVELEITLLTKDIKKFPISLIVAFPRPQTLKKILETAGTFGIQKLFLIQTGRVEKSYFQSKLLKNKAWLHHLRLGMEQGENIHLPQVTFWPSFDSFQKQLKEKENLNILKIILEPEASKTLWDLSPDTWKNKQPLMAAIGPEGGWLKEEITFFKALGFEPIRLGSTIHRVENAVTALLAQSELLMMSSK